jgi:hypothetical protein
MKQIKHIIIIVILLVGFSNQAQVSEDAELFNTLKANDSLLFEVGFNTCDIRQFENLMADDLEFYHDKSGALNSMSQFVDVMKNGICNPSNTFKVRRELIEGSIEVFPLYNNGVLYAAIQMGEHQFYEKNKDQQENAGSLAKFTHLWILDNNHWKLKRILSYDHKI